MNISCSISIVLIGMLLCKYDSHTGCKSCKHNITGRQKDAVQLAYMFKYCISFRALRERERERERERGSHSRAPPN